MRPVNRVLGWFRTRAIAGGLAVGLVAACGSGPPSSAPVASGSAAPSAVVGPSPALATGTPAASPAAGTAVDEALLDVLPVAIDGIERQGDAETAAEIAGSEDIGLLAEAVAVALYVGPPTEGAETEYAVVTVTRLRDRLLDESFHRDWRDSFDAAVCAQAGGVAGNAEAEIEGRQTFIGTCSGGVRTYHVALEDDRTLVSLQTLGEGRLGERIVAGLAE